MSVKRLSVERQAAGLSRSVAHVCKRSRSINNNKKMYKKSGGAGPAPPSFWDEWEFFACDILAAIGMNAAIVSLVSPAIRTRGSIGLNAFTATRKRGRSVAFLTISAQVGACCYAMGFVMQTLAEVLYDARTSSSSSTIRTIRTFCTTTNGPRTRRPRIVAGVEVELRCAHTHPASVIARRTRSSLFMRLAMATRSFRLFFYLLQASSHARASHDLPVIVSPAE